MMTAPQQRRGIAAMAKPIARSAPARGFFSRARPRQLRNPQRAQERPEQNQRGDEQGAVEIAFEIKPREARQNAVRNERLAEPKEGRRHKCSQQNDASEIEQESGRVFQEC